MNEQLSQTQAAQVLDSINHSRTAMRTAIRAYNGHWYLWLWGVIWLGIALLGQFSRSRFPAFHKRFGPNRPRRHGTGRLCSIQSDPSAAGPAIPGRP